MTPLWLFVARKAWEDGLLDSGYLGVTPSGTQAAIQAIPLESGSPAASKKPPKSLHLTGDVR